LPFEALVEEIDIGGPSLLRAAAKNFHDVLVVVEPSDYDRVLQGLDVPGGPPLSLRFDLARGRLPTPRRTTGRLPPRSRRSPWTNGGAFSRSAALRRCRPLVAGPDEDPRPALRRESASARAWYRESDRGFGGAIVHQGKELSFTNLLDLDAAARIVREFTEPAAVVIKHTNPCGAASGSSVAEAYVRAREADALSAFGGIVGLNRPIDLDTARALTSTFIEAVIAPGVEDRDDVRAALAAKANLRVVTASFDDTGSWDARTILGAWLVQAPDRVTEAAARGRVLTARAWSRAVRRPRPSGPHCNLPGGSART
jgi:phosphoribosylaminoimidazolecarboxamide formyltransferase/IMP cyclohydrolase